MNPTDKLLAHFIPLTEVVGAKDEGVYNAEESDHVRDVVGGLQLVHDHTEPILLDLHTLPDKLKQIPDYSPSFQR